jgi:hypothetical protein
MDSIDLNDYVAGGYYIGAYTSRPSYKESYLPERIVSISECRGDITRISLLPLDDESYSTYLEKQGVSKEKQDAARNWYTTNLNKEISFPEGFYSLSAAKQFASTFMELREDHFIVGIGLHKSFTESFVKENDILISKHASDEQFENWQLKRGEPFGVNKMIRQQLPFEPNGEILGFEPVDYFVGFVCGYICNVDQFAMVEELHTYPNKYGLIDSFEIANIVRSWRGTDDTYYPWLIVQYPIL